jgi:pimeloyl-ACP methyl ester carboxylesterase
MSATVLVLLHGYPFDHTMWDHVVALLPIGTPLVVPDLRGFGDAPARGDDPSIDRMADDVADLLAEKNIARAVVAGMSMGGYVALSFAQRYKERLQGLGLISTQAAADTEQVRVARTEMIERVRREGPSAAVQGVISKLFAPENANRPELTRFPLLGGEKAGVEGISWALQAMARRPDRSEILRSLQIPVLVLHGAKDQIIPAQRARDMADLPRANYVEVPNAGHATPLEAPDAVARALLDLLVRCAI